MVKALVLSFFWMFGFAFAVVGSAYGLSRREHNWVIAGWLVITVAIFLGVYLTEKGV